MKNWQRATLDRICMDMNKRGIDFSRVISDYVQTINTETTSEKITSCLSCKFQNQCETKTEAVRFSRFLEMNRFPAPKSEQPENIFEIAASNCIHFKVINDPIFNKFAI